MTTNSPHAEIHIKVGGLLKEAVFGFNDGVVSTFAVIAGLTGGLVSSKTILLAALATLFAGAFSMGLGTYLGSKTEKEHYENELKRELFEMKELPEIEKQEIRDIYTAKGFKGDLLEKVVDKITSRRELWLQTMMQEELGFAQSPPKPSLNGLVMSAAFSSGSIIPSLPYFFDSENVISTAGLSLPAIFIMSLVLSMVGLLTAGGLKTFFTKKNIVLSAFETLIIGAFAAGGSYAIGVLLT